MKIFSTSLLVVLSVLSFAQNNSSSVLTCTDFHITKPLSELAKEQKETSKKYKKVHESEDREHRTPQKFIYSPQDGVQYGEDPVVRQTEMGKRSSLTKAPIKNWQGQTSNSRPSDPSGAVGPNHYVQCVNASPFRVYDKNTGANLLTVTLGTLWNPDVSNEGDPIVMYDQYADRWFIAQFGSPSKVYIAISTTNNPTGSYYTYTFNSAQFPDYLKFSIWADGYYMTSNQNTQRVYCFERDQMLLGNASSRAVSATFSPGNTSGFYCPLPADADRGLPTLGTPCTFFAYSDNAWGGGAVDGIKMWNMAVSWGATPSATITAQPTVSTSAFDASYNSSWNDVSQPGTSSKLDGIGGVLTYRAQYRQWSGYNTIVLNWGVKISSTQRAVRWAELRQDQNTNVWSLYQEGTYAPDAHTRWIGSIAMDDNGSIGFAYCKSSTTVYPSLCYTGRLATDPLGQMTFEETVAAAGNAAETSANRYGDYSQLTLDTDGLTFWHTGEYTTSGSTKTRIYSFQIPLTSEASIAISANDLSICPNQSITLTAVPTNGGTAPTYTWKVNGNVVGTNSTIFTSTTLVPGDVVTCELVSNTPGVTNNPTVSNTITMTAAPASSITINQTAGSNPTCQGSNVGFTASVLNGGLTPSYQWILNGNNVGTGSTYYSNLNYNSGDIVYCNYTSTCASISTVSSNQVTMTVIPLPTTPTISQNGNVLTSSSATGNQWYLNGLAISGATGQNYSPTQNGNYTVKVTASGCPSAASTVLAYSTLSISEVTNEGTHFYLYPNPSYGVFSLVFTSTEIMKYTVKLQNALGQIIYEEKLDNFNGTYIKDFDITKYSKGEYYLIITGNKNVKYEKLIVY